WRLAGIEDNVQDWMELNSVGGDPGLAMQKIKHTHTRDLYRNVGSLKACGRTELGVKFGAGVRDLRQERAARCHAGGRRYLRDHRISGCILDHQVIVGVALQLE